MTEPRLMSGKDAAAYCSVTPETFSKWVASGIPPVPISKKDQQEEEAERWFRDCEARQAARVIHRSEGRGMTKLQDDFAMARGLIDWLETRVDHERVRETLVRVTASLRFHGRPPKKAGNKPRGLGFTFDEALIMGSLPDYENSIEKAARAYWQGLDEDKVDSNIKKLYRHKKELEKVGEHFGH